MLSRAEDPDAWARAAAMPTSWVPFMLEDPVGAACMTTTGRRYPAYQFALLDGDEAVGKVRSVPLPWHLGRTDLPAHGWDAVLLETAGAEERPANGRGDPARGDRRLRRPRGAERLGPPRPDRRLTT